MKKQVGDSFRWSHDAFFFLKSLRLRAPPGGGGGIDYLWLPMSIGAVDSYIEWRLSLILRGVDKTQSTSIDSD